MKRKITYSCGLLILVVMLFPVAGAAMQEQGAYESTQIRNEDGTISVTISKDFMDRYEGLGVFESLIEDIEDGNDEYVARTLMVSEVLEYAMTESGDVVYTVTEAVYQEYEEACLAELQEIFKEQEETYAVKIEYDRDFTDICVKMRADDYEKLENNNLLLMLRGMEEVYHAVSGTLGIPMSVTVIDPDTNMQLDGIDDFEWIQELTQMVEDKKNSLEQAGEE